MLFKVRKSILEGAVPIPPSKSHTIRAVFIASLASGSSVIRNPLLSEDGLSAIRVCEGLGAEIQKSADLTVQGLGGNIRPKTDLIDVGNSGTSARFVLGMASLGTSPITVTGDDQTTSRPMKPLLDSLTQLGARYTEKGEGGRLPVEICGRIKGGRTKISGVTSQYLSSLLIHCPLAENDTEIEVDTLNEKSYVGMTLRWLDNQGIRYEREGWERFKIQGAQEYGPFDEMIPGDFSSATFFLCAGAMGEADLKLEGLNFHDSQGDKKVVDFLKEMGADIRIEKDGICVRKGKLRGIEIDMNDTPDALPAMAVLGCFAEGETRLRNVPQARIKETDRIAVMASELRKMGADIEELEDGLIVRKSNLKGTAVQGHGDHRVVMSLAIAGLFAEGETVIDTAEAVNVTFPNFPALVRLCGGILETE